MIEEYKEAIAAFVVGLGGVFALVWGKVQSMRTEKAQTDAQIVISQSQEKVYEQMQARLTLQEERIMKLETRSDELLVMVRERDEEIHKLKMHIKDMEAIMRANNLPVLPML